VTGRGKPRRRRGRGRSGQLTYYPAWPEPETPEPAPPPRGDPLHGYTIAGIHAAARLAANSARGWLAADYHDQYEAAWYGICEHLLEAATRPAHHDLVRAGQDAVNRMVHDELHHAGFFKYKNHGTAYGPGSMPAFIKFWNNPVHPPSPEDVIETRALAAIWRCLTARQQQALAALAACEDYGTAAQAMGISDGTFRTLIKQGRQRFLALWHEGESPSRIWRIDKRTGRRQDVTPEHAAAREAYRLQAAARRARGQEAAA
jgi:hypothetical protein